jgi:hypothetical protein
VAKGTTAIAIPKMREQGDKHVELTVYVANDVNHSPQVPKSSRRSKVTAAGTAARHALPNLHRHLPVFLTLARSLGIEPATELLVDNCLHILDGSSGISHFKYPGRPKGQVKSRSPKLLCRRACARFERPVPTSASLPRVESDIRFSNYGGTRR